MRTPFYFIFALLFAFQGIAQDTPAEIKPIIENRLTKPYPDGVYKSVFDFTRKVPTNQYAIVPKSMVGLNYEDLKGTPEQCFFFYKFGENPKINDAFAICYQGNVYFRIKAILDNKSKRGRSETAQFSNSFVRVSVQAQKYLYTDVDFANAWTVGATSQIRGANMYASKKNTAVIWDSDEKVFHILKFCEDFNAFIAPLKPELVQQCAKNQHADADVVKAAMQSLVVTD
jgi:hypothetical protein